MCITIQKLLSSIWSQQKGATTTSDIQKVRMFARTFAQFVFHWKLDVAPVSSDFRVWKVSNIDDISEAYCRLESA